MGSSREGRKSVEAFSRAIINGARESSPHCAARFAARSAGSEYGFCVCELAEP